MGSRRGLQPAAGAFLCLGAGVAVIALGDADSETKRRISTRASKLRGEVLLKALCQRLHPTGVIDDGAGATPVPQAAAPTETSTHRFYVLTGPDAHLTSTARERWSHTLVGRGSIGAPGAHSTLHGERGAADDDNTGSASILSPWPVVRLGVPYDCALGTGLFSSLVDQQLVWPQHASPADHGGRSGGEVSSSVLTATAVPQLGGEVARQHEQQQSPYSSTAWDTAGGEDERDKEHESLRATPPPTATRVAPNPVEVSTWDSVVLWATQAVLDGEQLDTVALSSLEQALASGPCGTNGETSPSPADASSTRSNDNTDNSPQDALSPASDVPPSNTGASTAKGRCSFLLDIGWSPSQELGEGEKTMVGVEPAAAAEGGGRTDGSESGALLCVDLARWGWKLASRGLGTVMISSSNPWVLAELQQALQQALSERDGLSEESSEKSCDRQGSSGEVVVMRVALPSASQREQEVVAVARELGLHHQLSLVDVSMLAEVTGGRRAGLLDILKRVKKSSTAVNIAEACRATVDGEALALAATWGLLPRDGVSGATGGSEKNREDWSPLWEAMGMLSVPSVVVGAAAAASKSSGTAFLAPGAAPAASPPPGSAHPAQLLEECSVDGTTLLRLTKEGWLELSPAAPPGSGTVLEDLAPHSPLAGAKHDSPPPLPLHDGLHRSPPLTVHAAIVPLESLSRGVDRSFVGAPPLRLAAFRRLLDRRSSPKPSEISPGVAKDAGRQRSDREGVYVGIGDGAGGLQRVGEGSNSKSDSRAGSKLTLGGDFVGGGGGGGIGAVVQGESIGDWHRAGLQGAGGNQELEQAGCLIEAGVLGRQHSREEAKLSEDRRVLSSNWAELGTVRRDLEKEGKNDDTSDGEWAEVQLELIRQEKAVVARANEMRARRTRLDTLRRDIIDLEKHAGITPPPPSLPPGNSRQNRQHQDTPLAPPQPVPEEAEWAALNSSGSRAGVSDKEPSWAADFVEEEVIRDAEAGVRLMPLLPTNRDRGQDDGSYSSSFLSASGAVGSSDDGGGGGDGDGDGDAKGRGYGFGRLWRWVMRGSR